MKFLKIPAATITRLSLYSRVLEDMERQGTPVVSSKHLAEMCGVNPAQIRKDLAYFGQFGVRGVGYYVKELLFDIRKILGLNKEWRVAIVGMGNLGCALIAHQNFAKQGYRFVAAFDADPMKVGRKLATGLLIHAVTEIAHVCREVQADLGVICTPAEAAQDVANRFAQVPIKGILNFAPTQIGLPDGFKVENVDFTVKLDNLAYHLTAG
jgi:redox-sensing transcriptional repressor